MPRPRNILVVEPSPENQAVIGECLEQLGDVQAICTGSGRRAVDLFLELRPALVLLDVALPDLNGLQVAEQIRRLEKAAGQSEVADWTPLIFLSAVTDEETLAAGIHAGGDDFLAKPISEIVLLAKLRAMLRIVDMQRALRLAHRRLKEISYLDGLTQIPNRRSFDDLLEREWLRCARLQSPLGAIMVDVDFFKQFNDLYGHQEGDACLKAVATTLAEALFRVEDFVARYGGEEFVVLLPGTDLQGTRAVAERMRNAVRELQLPHAAGIGGLASCSFGVAEIVPSADAQPIQLVRRADQALYNAKKGGRNRVATLALETA